MQFEKSRTSSPGNRPALCSWGPSLQPGALRDLCPIPQCYHASLLWETAETGLRREDTGTTPLSLPRRRPPQPVPGTQGGEAARPRHHLESHAPRGLVPRGNRPGTTSGARGSTIAPLLLPNGLELDPDRPLICMYSYLRQGQQRGTGLAWQPPLFGLSTALIPAASVNIGSKNE